MHSFMSSKFSAFCKTLARNFSFLLKAVPQCDYFYDHFEFGKNTRHTVNVKEASLQCELVLVSSGFLLS